MSDAGWEIATPPFDAVATLLTLKRFVRDQQLAERGDAWNFNGQPVLKLAVEGDAVAAQLAKRPAQSPEWERFALRAAPDARKLQDEIKRRLLRWRDER